MITLFLNQNKPTVDKNGVSPRGPSSLTRLSAASQSSSRLVSFNTEPNEFHLALLTRTFHWPPCLPPSACCSVASWQRRAIQCISLSQALAGTGWLPGLPYCGAIRSDEPSCRPFLGRTPARFRFQLHPRPQAGRRAGHSALGGVQPAVDPLCGTNLRASGSSTQLEFEINPLHSQS